MTDDLVSWLRARLDEDERIARAATEGNWQAHRYDFQDDFEASIGTYFDANVVGHGHEGGGVVEWADAEFIAANDPVRVLREIDAKRRIIDEAFRHAAKIDGEWGCCCDAAQIEAGECPETPPAELPILRLLALPYADRPGYREEWKP